MRAQVINAEGKFDVIIQRAVERGDLPFGTTAEFVNEVGPAVVMMRLVFRGEPLDDAFTAHMVDEILLPILQRSRTSI
jgi:hypothetical protein